MSTGVADVVMMPIPVESHEYTGNTLVILYSIVSQQSSDSTCYLTRDRALVGINSIGAHNLDWKAPTCLEHIILIGKIQCLRISHLELSPDEISLRTELAKEIPYKQLLQLNRKKREQTRQTVEMRENSQC